MLLLLLLGTGLGKHVARFQYWILTARSWGSATKWLHFQLAQGSTIYEPGVCNPHQTAQRAILSPPGRQSEPNATLLDLDGVVFYSCRISPTAVVDLNLCPIEADGLDKEAPLITPPAKRKLS